jgi:predicted site-specific integrase-resolvase
MNVKNSFGDEVHGWAEISKALGCSVRTAQRWAEAGGFSLYKVPGSKPPRVYARKSEIAAWRARSSPFSSAPLRDRDFGSITPAIALKPHDSLWGWKEIARFINVSPRTAQRWEREAQLPVHRLNVRRRPLPYAREVELLTWIRERTINRQSVSEIDIPRQKLPALLQSFLDALTAHIAVIDATGTIVSVNKAWRAFSRALGSRDPSPGVGRNYFKVCRRAACVDADAASRLADSLGELLSGERRDFKVKYQSNCPSDKRDFLLSATPFVGLTAPLLVVSHLDLSNVV